MAQKKGLVVVLSGFSGAGKGTIMKHLLNKYPGMYNLSISATTRGKRQGEEEGREYFFKTREEFDRMVANNEFLEHATFNGNSYGTPKAYVQKLIDEGKDVILEIEVNGALQVKKIFPDALLLFVTPPSAAELKNRLVGRGTETADVVAQRLSISSKESLLMPKYDYLVINDQIDESVERVHMIIQSAHYATKANTAQIAELQEELKAFSKGENK
ncbi:MAG TPA: guanylate kinase [Lachnospiraceae bacterium]|nr:guanylate kinase [Lachnospiraceae bacterium]MDD7664648.1 guanylate kinase [Lachnospiraceae bacterium]MDY4165639.1 guanylate kinase [Lachnospiraceae bacterium]HAP03651.1 guanylate kinase [Lachnospiraceae bacterium]